MTSDLVPTVRVAGLPFARTDLAGACGVLRRAALSRRPVSFHFANAYCVASAVKDRSYFEVLSSGGATFPDGTPVVWFMRVLDGTINSAARVRGPSAFSMMLSGADGRDIRHFFLGASDETLMRLTERVARTSPATIVAGTYAPPYGPLDEAFFHESANRIDHAHADLVWIALGSPKQDFAASKLAALTQTPCAAVGAAFDFYAGSTREAPLWMQSKGLEWIFRLATEPRRLWRRYLIGNWIFLYEATRYAIARRIQR